MTLIPFGKHLKLGLAVKKLVLFFKPKIFLGLGNDQLKANKILLQATEKFIDENGVVGRQKLGSLRSSYKHEIESTLRSELEKLEAEGASDEQIARQLHRLRQEIRCKYQAATPEKLAEEIRARNLAVYGDEAGPTIDFLRTVKNKTWREIIESSFKTNEPIDLSLRSRVFNK
jgi:hypothetical protein